MYWAENGSTKTLKPSLSRTKSSSALLSSMRRLYLKPLHPPGCTLTRRPPSSAVTPSAAMNFFTSAAAPAVTVSSISGVVDVDINVLQGTHTRYCYLLTRKRCKRRRSRDFEAALTASNRSGFRKRTRRGPRAANSRLSEGSGDPREVGCRQGKQHQSNGGFAKYQLADPEQA